MNRELVNNKAKIIFETICNVESKEKNEKKSLYKPHS